ncbi:MAG TPA: copper resistance CopC family protein [Steroidobacteraceae bacterium]|nr:copper resistance CopC family protein [Steroidobacteraceae bacterium]
MSMDRTCAALLLALALMQPAFEAAAHTTLESSTPPSGATLEQSPPVIEMKFHQPINLTSVVVVAAGKAGRKLDFTPRASAAVFQLPDPQLRPGRNEITWKGLSKDGHVVTGSLVFEIKPREAKAPDA